MGDVSQLVALVNGSFDEHFPMLMSMLEPVTVMIRDLGVSSAATADKLALIAASTLFWTLLHIALHPLCYYTLPARNYKDADVHVRHKWTESVAGFVHALVSAGFAMFILLTPDQAMLDDPIYGYSERCVLLLGVSSGYFLWDTAQCIVWEGWGMIIHGSVCFCLYSCCLLTPWMMWYGAAFLMFELSTPMLRFRTWLIMLGKADSGFFTAVSIVFFLQFVGCRILFGVPMSIEWWLRLFDMMKEDKLHSLPLTYCYLAANVILNGLNFFWLFGGLRMVLCPRKPKKDKTKAA